MKRILSTHMAPTPTSVLFLHDLFANRRACQDNVQRPPMMNVVGDMDSHSHRHRRRQASCSPKCSHDSSHDNGRSGGWDWDSDYVSVFATRTKFPAMARCHQYCHFLYEISMATTCLVNHKNRRDSFSSPQNFFLFGFSTISLVLSFVHGHKCHDCHCHNYPCQKDCHDCR